MPTFRVVDETPKIVSNQVVVRATRQRAGRLLKEMGSGYDVRSGFGEGLLMGEYGIPTRVGDALRRNTLNLATIAASVNRLLAFASAHPELDFFITQLGIELSPNGEAGIAPLFASAPENVLLPMAWRALIPSEPNEDAIAESPKP